MRREVKMVILNLWFNMTIFNRTFGRGTKQKIFWVDKYGQEPLAIGIAQYIPLILVMTGATEESPTCSRKRGTHSQDML